MYNIYHNQSSSLADNLSHVHKSVLLQKQGLEAVLKTGAAEAVSPTTQYYSRGHVTSLKTLGVNISINEAFNPINQTI